MLRIIVQYPFCLLSLKFMTRGMCIITFFSYMTANDLIYNRQSGFQQFHSTETALIKLVDQLLFDMDNNRINGVVLVEYQKAFDMVDHCLLLPKLEIYGLDDHALQWINLICTTEGSVSN